METLDGMVLWSVWCDHYENKKDYNRCRKRDLREFSEYIAARISKSLMDKKIVSRIDATNKKLRKVNKNLRRLKNENLFS